MSNLALPTLAPCTKERYSFWLINPYDRIPGEQDTDGRYGALSHELLARGHHIHWWSSSFCHASKSRKAPPVHIPGGLNVTYIHTPAYNRNIGLGRLWNCWRYADSFRRISRHTTKLPDLIIASMPPIESAYQAVRFGAKHNLPVILDVQDIWPEAFLLPFPKPLRPLAKLGLTPYFHLAAASYRATSAISGVSPDYVNLALSNGHRDPASTPHHVAFLGYDQLTVKRITAAKSSKKTCVVFSGTLGHTYDIDTIINAAEKVNRTNEIEWLIIGDGPLTTEAKVRARNLKLQNLHFTGRIPFHQVIAHLKASAIGLNAYCNGAPQSFTNKICEYAGTGLAIINSLPGAVATFIEEHNCGLNYQAGNSQALATSICQLLDNPTQLQRMRSNALNVAQTTFARSHIYPQFADFVERVVKRQSLYQSST